MILKRSWLFLAITLTLASLPLRAQQVSEWLTNPDRTSLLKQQSPGLSFAQGSPADTVIDIDDKKYQTIDGFGFALTGGSAQLIEHMDAEPRAALLKQLFSTE
ncbi:MAG TPA: hypothetical protein VK596_02360, partial [Edaphobacter sp.]|nr:hypothetical protein [Edaphobacter sp.]